MRHRLTALAAACALAWPGAARADWMEASSPHFVVYANESRADIARFAQDLELYHHAMAKVTGLDLPDPSPSNRVTVFVVSSDSKVQQLYGPNSRYIGGFYLPRAGDSIAIIPQVRATSGQPTFSMITLLHEYAHHFLISNSNLPSPRWLAEGAAEFFASAEFPSGGGIKIGMPAYQRAGELFYAKDVPVEKLLDPKAYDDGTHSGFDSFYGKSWLLYHYLVLGDQSHWGELQKYAALMAKGEDSLQAGRDAFGDLKALDNALDKYLNQSRMLTIFYAADKLPPAEVTVRALSEGEQAVLPSVIRTRRGVDAEQAKDVLDDVHKVAAKYPHDPAVLTELAEAECDAGNLAQAVAAADAALALDPNELRAYYEKGRALFAQAEKTFGEDGGEGKNDAGGNGEAERAAAYKAAVAPFIALNKLENDNPLPLIYYFRSYAERGVEPPKQAVLGLMRAAELAPYDLGLRLNLAEYQIGAGDYVQARANLVPIAFDPHGTPMSDGARTLIERIDAGKPPDAREAAGIIADSVNAAAAAANGGKGGAGEKGGS